MTACVIAAPNIVKPKVAEHDRESGRLPSEWTMSTVFLSAYIFTLVHGDKEHPRSTEVLKKREA
jgi:hypothetical protein